MTSSRFASSFAPYTPPPDDPSWAANNASTSKPVAKPWFPAQPSLPSHNIESSYQSGAIPTFGASATGGLAEAEGQQSQWETTHGWRVDLLAAAAYVLGPISALAILIFETQNDYVRFHAYQSALLSTPLVVFRMFASLVGFTPWLRTFLTLGLIIPLLFMAFQAYRDATYNGLVHFHLPIIGAIAEKWVGEE